MHNSALHADCEKIFSVSTAFCTPLRYIYCKLWHWPAKKKIQFIMDVCVDRQIRYYFAHPAEHIMSKTRPSRYSIAHTLAVTMTNPSLELKIQLMYVFRPAGTLIKICLLFKTLPGGQTWARSPFVKIVDTFIVDWLLFYGFTSCHLPLFVWQSISCCS